MIGGECSVQTLEKRFRVPRNSFEAYQLEIFHRVSARNRRKARGQRATDDPEFILELAK